MAEIILYTVDEAAEILKIRPKTLSHFIYTRQIEHIKVGGKVRLTPEALQTYLNKRTIKVYKDWK